MRRSREWESCWEACWEFWSRRYLQINMWNRSISRAKQKQKQQNDIDFASVCCFKLLEFELFEFLLIDAFWLTADVETEICEDDELNWLRNRFTLTVVLHLFMSFALVSLLWCNRFIFVWNIDCEDVKNRRKQRMRFWCRCNELIEIAVTNSLIEFHWSRLTETETRRSEIQKFFVRCFEC